MNVRQQIILLRGRIKILENNKKLLEAQVKFLTTHQTLRAGITGETIIANAVEGAITPYARSYDVQSRAWKLEVKFSRLRRAGSRKGDNLRWAWLKLFGEGGNKTYDFLVLIGEKDDRYRENYLDTSTRPYVFFLIPQDDVASLVHHSRGYQGIWIRSNPRGRRHSRADRLFSTYQISYEDLEQRFRPL